MAGKLTPEEAKELGRRGGLASAKVRAERAKLRGDILAKSRFEKAADEMAELLLAAARGDEEFSVLTPKDRVAAAMKALEYGIGRARAMEPSTPEEAEEQAGLAFAVREEDEAIDLIAGVGQDDG